MIDSISTQPSLTRFELQGKAASMGLATDQAPAYGHQKIPEGIEGLEVSFCAHVS